MSRKVLVWFETMGICLLVLFAGCATEARRELAQADLALKFAVGDVAKYKVTQEDIKDFRFEQPSLDKVRLEPRSTTVEIKFLQQIESVDEQGNATAKITIRGIKYLVMDKNKIDVDFDSKRKADRKKPFAKLIGKSYKIRISPDGSVKVLDANKIRNAVRSGPPDRASNLVDDKVIQRRHEILSLPDVDSHVLRQGDTWSRIKTPPHRLMVQKSFEKVYTLKKVEDREGRRLALVDMNATESGLPAQGVSRISPGGMGIFANLFDTEETYTGEMVLDLNTGKVAKYNEKLVTKYVAAEPKPDKGPDVLTITLTYATSVEMLD